MCYFTWSVGNNLRKVEGKTKKVEGEGEGEGSIDEESEVPGGCTVRDKILLYYLIGDDSASGVRSSRTPGLVSSLRGRRGRKGAGPVSSEESTPGYGDCPRFPFLSVPRPMSLGTSKPSGWTDG